jgi:peptidoglycan/xylan/chitin deacetylase (PgdA/CDA1 family)
VALTFDDGPHSAMTDRILTALRRTGAPGSFFLIGRRMEREPELVRRIQAEGHEVGNHTWTHQILGRWPGRSPDEELARTEELLGKLAPGSARIFRPPFGLLGPGGGAAVNRSGLLPIYWSVVPKDWDPLPARVVRERVLAGLHPGAVVVLHGGQPWHAGKGEGIEEMIRAIRERGYEIVGLRRMLEAGGYAIGER